MSADEIRVEAVARAKRPGMVRHWLGEELVAGTCRVDGVLHPAEELVAHRRVQGGRALICRAHNRAASSAYTATPLGAEKQKARDRHRVESGDNAERKRRARTRHAARSPEEVAAYQRHKHPSGVKRCRSGHEAPLEAFPLNVTAADGLQEYCREHHGATPKLLRAALPRWEEADLWTCVYTGEPYDDLEHVIPSTCPDAEVDLDAPGNLVPSSWQANRGPGGKFDRPVLDFVEELHGSGVIDWLLAGGVIERTLPAA